MMFGKLEVLEVGKLEVEVKIDDGRQSERMLSKRLLEECEECEVLDAQETEEEADDEKTLLQDVPGVFVSSNPITCGFAM